MRDSLRVCLGLCAAHIGAGSLSGCVTFYTHNTWFGLLILLSWLVIFFRIVWKMTDHIAPPIDIAVVSKESTQNPESPE